MKILPPNILLLSLLVTCSVWVCSASTPILKIKIASGSYSDEIAIRYMQGATTGYDGCCDAWKFFAGNNAVPQLFTRTDDGDELAINSLPSLSGTNDLNLFVRTGSASTYSISPTQVDSFSTSTTITLIDNSNGNVYDLRTITTYIISLPPIALGDAARFDLKVVPPALLPVSLTLFSAVVEKDHSVNISWTTASEINNKLFGIERSEDGNNWNEVAAVNGSGNTASIKNYDFNDKEVPSSAVAPILFYRLRQIDFNGEQQFFGPISVYRTGQATDLSIFPTVSNGTFFIAGNTQNSSIKVYTQTGEMIFFGRIPNAGINEIEQINLPNTSNGIYFLKIMTGASEISKKIIINK